MCARAGECAQVRTHACSVAQIVCVYRAQADAVITIPDPVFYPFFLKQLATTKQDQFLYVRSADQPPHITSDTSAKFAKNYFAIADIAVQFRARCRSREFDGLDRPQILIEHFSYLLVTSGTSSFLLTRVINTKVWCFSF